MLTLPTRLRSVRNSPYAACLYIAEQYWIGPLCSFHSLNFESLGVVPYLYSVVDSEHLPGTLGELMFAVYYVCKKYVMSSESHVHSPSHTQFIQESRELRQCSSVQWMRRFQPMKMVIHCHLSRFLLSIFKGIQVFVFNGSLLDKNIRCFTSHPNTKTSF